MINQKLLCTWGSLGPLHKFIEYCKIATSYSFVRPKNLLQTRLASMLMVVDLNAASSYDNCSVLPSTETAIIAYDISTTAFHKRNVGRPWQPMLVLVQHPCKLSLYKVYARGRESLGMQILDQTVIQLIISVVPDSPARHKLSWAPNTGIPAFHDFTIRDPCYFVILFQWKSTKKWTLENVR